MAGDRIKCNILYIGVLLILSNITCYSQKSLNVDSLLLAIKTLPNDSTKVKSMIRLSSSFINQNPEKAQQYADEALNLAEKINDPNSIAASHNYLGVIKRSRGEYDEAILHYKKSFDIYSSNKDIKGVSICCMNLGVTYGNKGDYTNALQFFIKTLKINEKINNKEGIGECYSNIGNVHYLLGNFDRSMNYYQNSLKIFKDLNILNRMSISYSNIGASHEALNNFNKAINYYNASLEIDKKLNDNFGISITYSNIGNLYLKLNKYDKAQEYYQYAYKIAEEIDDISSIAYLDGRLSQLYFNMGQYQKSIEYGKKSMIRSKEFGDLEGEKFVYKILTNSFEKLNNYEKALEYQKLYTIIKDSILNAEKNKQILEIETRYQIEKKQQKIETQALKIEKQNSDLKKRKTQIIALIGGVVLMILLFIVIYNSYRNKKRATRILSEQKNELNTTLEYTKKLQNALKNDLSHYMQISLRKMMNPHFIFNSLNSIQSFILQNDKLKASLYLSKFSDLMRKVLDFSQMEFIPLQNEIETLELYIELEQQRFNDRFSYNIDVDSSLQTNKIVVPPLIFQPFVENSIWHGLIHKNEEGFLKISIKSVNSSLICCIEDNGIGRKKSMEINKNKRKHESFGIKATRERLKIVNSINNQDIDIIYHDLVNDNGEASGTKVEFKIPVYDEGNNNRR